MNNRVFVRWATIASLGLVGCISEPDCYFDDECAARSQCVNGACARSALSFDLEGAEPTWQSDVQPIFMAQCVSCHRDPPINDAPFPLVTYEQAIDVFGGASIPRLTAERVLSATEPTAEPQYSLSDRQIALIRQWVADETPRRSGPVLPPDGGVVGPDGAVPQGALIVAGTPASILTRPGIIRDVSWDPVNQRLLFISEEDLGTSVFGFRTTDGITETLVAQTSRGRGVAVDPQGNPIVAEYGTRRLTRYIGETFEDLASEFQGRRFNAPHDLTVRAEDGQVYFTDPAFGVSGPRSFDFNGLFRFDNLGLVQAEWQGTTLSGPTGVAYWGRGLRLYMVESFDQIVLWFDINADDGSVGDPNLFAVTGDSPADVAVDDVGTVFVATERGVMVYSSDGEYLGRLATPLPAVSVTVGGMDQDTVFMAVGSDVFAAPLR